MGDPLSITASVIAILQATSAAVNYFQGVRQAAKDITNFIGEFGSLKSILTSLCDYASANPDSTTLQKFDPDLRKCLNDITELHAKLAKGFSRRGVPLRWPLKDKEGRECLEKIERLKSSISLAMDLDRESRSKAIAIRDKKGMEDEKRTKALNWLNRTAYNERHLEISTRRQRDTGEWLLKEGVVVNWLGGKSSSHLLLGYGIPGAGKTFLCSRMIDDVRHRAAAANWGVAFMYFSHSEQNQQTPAFFLSSLVKQFAYQIIDLPEKPYELYDKLHPKQSSPTFEQLYSLLLAVTEPFTQAFVICDALDECEQKTQRRELLPLFKQMGEDGMRLFLTSRPYPEDIQRALQYASKVELSAKNEDITVYIERKIAENPRVENLVKQAKCKEEIISMLQTCANGMFLLVHFHIKYLCEQATPRQLLVAIDTLKDSSGESPMDPTYNRAMKTIQSQPKRFLELAVNILTWLVKSQQVLTVRQLQQAVSVEQHQTTFDELALPSEETILDVCASLVSIDQESNTVRLVHYTVQEYLVNNAIILKDAEFRIVITCATFLSYDGFSEGPCESWVLLRTRLDTYPFLRYAGAHFQYHLQQCDEALSLDLVVRFLKNRENVLSYLNANSWFGSWRSADYSKNDPLLNLAVFLGHTSAIESLLKQGADVSAQDTGGRTALHLAARYGYNSMIEVLLENGAELSPAWETPLHIAASFGQVSTVRLLIKKGANPSAKNSSGKSPLQIAVSNMNQEVVRILVEKGADVSVTDKEGQTPLHIAASHVMSKEVVRILLEKGADISATDNKRQTPLHIALSHWSEEVARILVEKGADVLVKDSSGMSPLHIALSHRYHEVTRILLEKGADVSDSDNKGQTPLHIATSRESQQVRMVRSPANVGLTPFYPTVSDEELVVILVERGADVSVADNKGQTPLHIAASREDQQIVRILVEKGADVSATDNKGQTPLHIAACHWSQEVVRILVERGADVSAMDKKGQTPLHTATSHWSRSSQNSVRKRRRRLCHGRPGTNSAPHRGDLWE